MGKKTVQTVQKGEPWFELAKTTDGWEWCLWGGNARPMAMSADSYGNQEAARVGIKNLLRILARNPSIKMLSPKEVANQDANGKGNDRPAGGGVPDDTGNGAIRPVDVAKPNVDNANGEKPGEKKESDDHLG